MPDISFNFIVSVGLAILGIVSMVRKRISIGIGRPPIGFATLTGDRTVLFGIVSFLAGIIPMALILYNGFPNSNRIEQGTLSFIVAIGIGIVVLTFIFELFVEFLVDLRKRAMNKEGKNGKHGNGTNN
jgi:hypothetical protein